MSANKDEEKKKVEEKVEKKVKEAPAEKKAKEPKKEEKSTKEPKKEAKKEAGISQPMYKIHQQVKARSDIKKIWVILDAMEKDLLYISKGMPVQIESDAYPGKYFHSDSLVFKPGVV